MFAEERQGLIVKQLNQVGKVSVKELSELYAVTQATIRNDLKALEDKDLLIKTYGGALTKTDAHHELDSDTRQSINELAKLAIGKKATELIKDYQTVLLDTGTTTYHIAKHIQDHRGLTVITNDFDIAKLLELSPHIQVLLLGGLVKTGYHCTYHHHYSAMLRELNIDIAFMGTNSLNGEGAFAADIQLAQTKRLMVQRANKIVMCCDNDKFERKAFSRFATLGDIDIVIADRLPENTECFEEHGIEMLIVDDF